MSGLFGGIATVLAVAGVFLNNRINIACFYLWIISNLICAVLHFNTGLWSLLVRDVIFIGFAIEGIIIWRRKRSNG
jgi:nicotinamide riboside transporter PnuC